MERSALTVKLIILKEMHQGLREKCHPYGSTHLIKDKNQTPNILLNIYGNDWWIDLYVSTER